MTLELGVRAGPDREAAQQQVEGLAQRPDVAVGTEVADPLALAAPEDDRARPLLVHGDGQPRVALVVLQPDVEAGLVGLDEGVLEDERVDLGGDHHPLDPVGQGHHLGGPGGQQRRVGPVVGQPVPQRLGLADVEDPALGVEELVGPRRVGDRAGGRPRSASPPLSRPGPLTGSGRSARAQDAVRSEEVAPRRTYTGGRRPGIPATYVLRGRQPRGWATRLSPPATSEPSPPRGYSHDPTPGRSSGALHRPRRPSELAEWIGAAKAALGDRVLILGHHYQRDEVMALGRRPGRLLRAVADRRRASGRRVHRLLRRALHGRVGRHPDRGRTSRCSSPT